MRRAAAFTGFAFLVVFVLGAGRGGGGGPRVLLDTANSSSATLAGDAVFTGSAVDVSQYATTSVFVFSDVASATNGLSLELSTDGTNWDRKKLVTLEAGTSQVHTLTVVSQYFRVVYTNGSGAQSSFRLQVIHSPFRERTLSSGTQQVMNNWDDTTLTRPVSDTELDRASGKIGYQTVVQKFGSNTAVGATEEDVWANGGSYNWLQTADELRIAAGGDAADDAGQAGCRQVTIEGLDSTFAAISEAVATAGASASSTTTAQFIRVNRAYCSSTGTYTGDNEAAIVIETEAGTTVANIEAGRGQTQLSMYTVPAGKTAYLSKLNIQCETTNTCGAAMYRRENADDVTTPFSPRRLVFRVVDFSGVLSNDYESMISFSAKTDIWLAASKITGGGDSEVSVNYDLILVDD